MKGGVLVKRTAALIAALIVASFCALGADAAAADNWNYLYWDFTADHAIAADSAPYVGETGVGEILLRGDGAGTFPTAALISRGTVGLDGLSFEFKAGEGFSFGVSGEFGSYISFTWGTGSRQAAPSSLLDVGNYASANYFPASARSLTLAFNGRFGTVSENMLVVLRDGNGGEELWSLPCEIDLSALTSLRITADGWQGLGYLITVNDLQITSDGTVYPALDLNALANSGPGFVTAAVCGGASGASALNLTSVCGTAAASFTGDGTPVTTDSDGVIVASGDAGTTEPSSVTGDGTGADNPDSGDEGIIIALACLAGSVIIGVIIVKKKRR